MTELLHHALHALMHTIEHMWYILPVLFVVFLLIEVLEHKAMDRLRLLLADKSFGIVTGAALGLFPQCGFSIAAANLYSERLITAGAVAAVFIATSDEALPIMLANPRAAKYLLPTLAIKFVWAVVVGIIVNAVFKLTGLDKHEPHLSHSHSEHPHEGGEHHHCAHCDSNRGIVSSAIKRTVSVFLFIFITGFILNFVIDLVGEASIQSFMMTNSVFQPLLTALIGLVPNCAASVVTTELFVSGAIGYGSLVSALCAGAGVGMLVLFRVNRVYKQNFTILGILYLSSAILGIVLELLI